MARQRAKKEIMHRITVNYDAWIVVFVWSEENDNIVRVLQKIERHKEQFLVPVLVSIQCSLEKIIYNQITRFFSRKYRVSSTNIVVPYAATRSTILIRS